LEKLFSWGLANFKKMNVFIPDKISTYTLQALGYPEDKAEKKTRLHDNNLRNKAIRALVKNNILESEAINKIIFLSDLIKNNKAYIKIFNMCNALYKDNESFKNGCLETSRSVLDSKEVCGNITSETVNIAVKYFLAELPIYFNTSEILNTHSSLYAYKEPPPVFLMEIYNNISRFSSLVSLEQGYLAVNFN
jgi:cyclo(L-tyrosyl-L-tyrosyl) synthase